MHTLHHLGRIYCLYTSKIENANLFELSVGFIKRRNTNGQETVQYIKSWLILSFYVDFVFARMVY